MTRQNAIKIFEERKVRSVWDDATEEWYFSIIDAVAALTDSADATAYWRKLKQRLKEEGNQTVTTCHAFKMYISMKKSFYRAKLSLRQGQNHHMSC